MFMHALTPSSFSGEWKKTSCYVSTFRDKHVSVYGWGVLECECSLSGKSVFLYSAHISIDNKSVENMTFVQSTSFVLKPTEISTALVWHLDRMQVRALTYWKLNEWWRNNILCQYLLQFLYWFKKKKTL